MLFHFVVAFLQDGAQVAVLGCDTLGGKKTQLSNEDRKVVTRSAQLLADVFNEIAAGVWCVLVCGCVCVSPAGTRWSCCPHLFPRAERCLVLRFDRALLNRCT